MKRTQRQPSASTKLKMSKAKKGSNNPNYGKRMSEQTKQKISEKMKKYWSAIPPYNNTVNNINIYE